MPPEPMQQPVPEDLPPGATLVPAPAAKPDELPPGAVPVQPVDPEADERRKDDEVQRVFEDGLTRPADVHARVLELTKLTGHPSDIIEGNEDAFEQTWKASQFKAREWRKANPALDELIQSSPAFGPVATHDEHISKLFRVMRAAGTVLGYLGEAWNQPGPTGSNIEEVRASAMEQAKAAEEAGTTVGATAPLPAPPTGSELFPPPKQVAYLESPLAKAPGWSVGQFVDTIAAEHAQGLREPPPLLPKPFQVLGEEYGQGAKQVELSKLGFRIMLARVRGEDTYPLEKQAIDLRNQLVPHYYGEDELSLLARDVAQLAPSQVETLKQGGVAGAVGAAGGAVIGAGAGALGAGAPGAVRGAVQGAKWGYRVASRLGVAKASFELESGSAYMDMADAKTDDGRPVPEDLRIGYSVAYGLAATAIEMEALPVVLGKLGPMGELLKKGEGKAFLAAVMKDRSAVQILKNVGVAWRNGSLAEGGQEAAQQAAQNFFTYLARSQAGGALQKPDLPGGLQEVADTFEQTFFGSIGSGPATMAFHGAQEAIGAASARRAQAQVRSVIETGKLSPTVKVAPSEVAKLMLSESRKDGDPVTHAYVDAKAFQRFFQSGNADAAAAADELVPGGRAALESAVAKGEKLEIPIDDFVAKWVPRPVADALVDDTTTRPGFRTANEMLAKEKSDADAAKAVAEKYQAEHPEAAQSEAEKRFTAALAKQLLATGRYDNAKDADIATAPFRAFIRTQAANFKATPDELFGDEAVSIEGGSRPGTALAQRFEQAAQQPGPVWHSAVEKAIQNAKQEKGDGTSWLSVISKTPGVKKEEIEHLDLPRTLQGMKGVTKQAMLDYVRAHRLEVKERVLGGYSPDRQRIIDARLKQLEADGISVKYGGQGVEAIRLTPEGEWMHPQEAMDLERDVDKRRLLHLTTHVLEGHVDSSVVVNGQVEPVAGSGSPRRRALAVAVAQGGPEKARAQLETEANKLREAARSTQEVLLDGKGRREFPTESEDWRDLDLIQWAMREGKAETPAEALAYVVKKKRELAKDLAQDSDSEDLVRRTLSRADHLEALDPARLTLKPQKHAAEHLSFLEAQLKELEALKGAKVEEVSTHNADPGHEQWSLKGSHRGGYHELLFYAPGSEGFRSTHFGEHGKGLLAHARVAEHTLADGTKALLVEEIQSDLHQAGREKGYKPADATDQVASEAVPDAPFKTSWEEMAAKRLVRWAAERGYEKIAWTTGKTQADRYSLEQHVQKVQYSPSEKTFVATDTKGEEAIRRTNVEPADLPGIIGKDIADKLLAAPQTNVDDFTVHELSGLDLKTGGEGMRFAYDKRLPGIFEKLVKKSGGTVQQERLGETINETDQTDHTGEKVWTATLPAAFREQVVREGMPLFQSPTDPPPPLMPGEQLFPAFDPERQLTINIIKPDLRAEVDALPRDEHGEPDKTALGKWAKRRVAGSYASPDLDGPVDVRSKGIQDAISHAQGNSKLAVAALPELIQSAVRVPPTLAHEPTDPNISGVHLLVSTLRLDDGLHAVLMKVKQTQQGAKFYHLIAVEIENPAHSAEGTQPVGTEPRDTPDTPGTIKVRQALEGVKGPDGKPLIPEASAKSDTLTQTDEHAAEPRGFVEFGREGMQRLFKIVLGKNADMSTFLHESGHVFLEMVKGLATREDAPAALKADWAAIQLYLGAKDGELTREHHEKWARSFEAYLYEGKAPSAGLVRAFTRFRLWLQQVYRSVSKLGVELNPEIRGVMDRLFATDEEIKRTREAMGLRALFRSPEEAGMSPEEWTRYLDEQRAAASHAQLAATHRVLKDKLRETESWWKDELAKAKEAAETEYEKLPVWRASQYVRKGVLEVEGGHTVQEPQMGRLDRQAVVDLLGKEPAKAFGNRLVKDGGEHPDDVAQLFGFDTGKAMLEALLNLPDRGEWVDAAAEDAMKAKHPDVLADVEGMRSEAAKGLHGEQTQSWLLREWKALRAKAGVNGTAPPAESIKAAARLLVERERVGGISLPRALQAERSAADRAFTAASKGDWALAFVHKQEQLLHHFMHRALMDAREERDRFETLLGRLADTKKRGEMGLAAPVFRDFSAQVLEALGAKEMPTGGAARLTLDDYVRRLEAEGLGPAFDVEAVRALLAKPTDWQNLTVADMRNISNALLQVKKLATDTLKVDTLGRKVEIQALADEIQLEASRLKDVGPMPRSESAAPEKWWTKQSVVGIHSSLLEPEFIIGRLGKAAHDFFWRGYLKSRNAEAELAKAVLAFFAKKWDALPKEMQRRRYDLVEVPDTLRMPEDVNRGGPADRQWVWMLWLNRGTKSNLERLLGGYGWKEEDLNKFLVATLTKDEMDFLQGVHDLLDKELFPKVAAQYEAVNGVPPTKLEAHAIETPYGTYRGGYFPAKYDPVASRLGAKQGESALQNLYSDPSARASVLNTFTRERAKTFTDVVNLQWGVVPSHLASVIHYVAFDSFVRDAGRVLFHPTVGQTLQRRLGVKYQSQVEAWLKAVASAQSDALPAQLQDWHDALNWGKSRIVAASMGYSFSVALGDLANPLVAMAGDPRVSVRAKYMSPLLARVFLPGQYGKWRSAALERSPELRFRAENWRHHFNRQIQEVGRIGKKSGVDLKLDKVREFAGAFMEFTDRLSSTLIWEGAYRQALAEGQDDKAALQTADDKLRAQMPSTEASERAGFLRDKRGTGALVVMFGYFSKMYTLDARLFEQPLDEWDAAEGVGAKALAVGSVARASARWMAVLFFSSVVSEFLSGRGPDPDETYPEWLLRKMVTAPFSRLPVVGGFGEYGANRAVDAALGKRSRHPLNVRAAPAAAALERIWNEVGNAATESRETDKRVWDLLEAYLTYKKLPATQVRKTGEYVERIIAGKEHPRDPFEFSSGLLLGKRKAQPANALTEISRAVR